MCSFTIEATDGFAAEDGSQARVARCRRFCHKTDEHEQPLHHLPILHWGRTFLGDPELAAKTKEYLEKELKVESGQPYKHLTGPPRGVHHIKLPLVSCGC